MSFFPTQMYYEGFEKAVEEYLEMKNKNVKTEDIIKELEQPKHVSMRKR